MKPLSEPQQRVLQAIVAYTKEHNRSPSHRELMALVGYRSTGSISRVIKTLKEKGALLPTERSWRGLLPTAHTRTEHAQSVEIIGHICKSKPLELLPTTYTIEVPPSLLQARTYVYGLIVQDASFIQEHCLPNDVIIIEPSDMPSQGDLVVASSAETFIGYYFEEDGMIHLRSTPYSSEGSIKSLSFSIDDIQIWGVIIALIRSHVSQTL